MSAMKVALKSPPVIELTVLSAIRVRAKFGDYDLTPFGGNHVIGFHSTRVIRCEIQSSRVPRRSNQWKATVRMSGLNRLFLINGEVPLMKLACQSRDVQSWSRSDLDSFVFVDFTPVSCCARPQGVAERMLLHLKLMPGGDCLHRRSERRNSSLLRSARQHPDGHGGPSGEKETESNAEPIISSVAGPDRSLIAWGAMLSLSVQRYLHLSALVGGLGSITSLAIPFLLKDIMHLHPAETALLGAIASIPMLFKPAVAMASDNLPLLGYRRKPYLVLGSMSHSMSLIALAHLPAATGFVPIALILLAMSTASAVVVTVKDTLMVA
ncbi:hypothetical protein FOZ63_022877 [Perkinsus olseni]|uniref:Uncharacterized protein n=1 Tax=Perkinsus olseni TaxID=32597 RepID=A0A7J6RPN0_PEROL|nr:hypothetical protein FOZ63_022877 [Perkinsus olseni]